MMDFHQKSRILIQNDDFGPISEPISMVLGALSISTNEVSVARVRELLAQLNALPQLLLPAPAHEGQPEEREERLPQLHPSLSLSGASLMFWSAVILTRAAIAAFRRGRCRFFATRSVLPRLRRARALGTLGPRDPLR